MKCCGARDALRGDQIRGWQPDRIKFFAHRSFEAEVFRPPHL